MEYVYLCAQFSQCSSDANGVHSCPLYVHWPSLTYIGYLASKY